MGSIIGLFFLGNIITNGTLSISMFPAQTAVDDAKQETPKASPFEEQEILWLARGVYSETKNEEEMRLIAWVIRNRVETKYRGTTYQEVLTSEKQFSGLHISSPQYKNNRSLGYDDTKNKDWRLALAVAKEVYTADESGRPFPKTVRHFYSPALTDATPEWAREENPYQNIAYLETPKPHFVFYNAIQ
ncbi:MAG: cell wall hydrolase [Candidatus Lloydbacteria bacterium]|nr:cell wall hydrolase [Candidatus Lloydbacteria bacterium]